jgi:hypothetical protein
LTRNRIRQTGFSTIKVKRMVHNRKTKTKNIKIENHKVAQEVQSERNSQRYPKEHPDCESEPGKALNFGILKTIL